MSSPVDGPTTATPGGETARRALRLLRAVALAQEPRRLAELQAETGLNKSVTYRLLRILQEEGYLKHTAEGYSTGGELIALALTALPRRNSYLAARPVMQALTYRIGETVTLHRRADDRAVIVLVAENQDRPIRYAARVGETTELARGCTGRAMLAQLPAHVVRQLLESTADTAETTLDDVERVRSSGWSYTEEANHTGVAGMACALPRRDPRAEVMTLNISGPVGRMNAQVAARLAPVLIDAAKKLSALGVNFDPAD